MSAVYYPNSNRLGRLLVLYETIAEHPEMLGALFAMGVVVEVEDHECGRGKVYTLAGKMFDALSEGDEIPEYRVEWVHDGAFENVDREASRVNSGRFGFSFVRKTVVRVPALHTGGHAQAPVLH